MGAFFAAVLASSILVVPFVPQQKDGCGAASLAMVLRYWEVPADDRAIANELGEPELRGIRGSRLAAFAAAQGMVAIPYAGDLDNLRDYLAKGRPLIVAWNMGHNRYHNVVVLGIDDATREIVVHDPARGAERRVGRDVFLKRWAGAGHWTLVVTPKAP
jgi:ABC-type bacteriocin/lantibiotic exporter with double-glycine peptidase domain